MVASAALNIMQHVTVTVNLHYRKPEFQCLAALLKVTIALFCALFNLAFAPCLLALTNADKTAGKRI